MTALIPLDRSFAVRPPGLSPLISCRPLAHRSQEHDPGFTEQPAGWHATSLRIDSSSDEALLPEAAKTAPPTEDADAKPGVVPVQRFTLEPTTQAELEAARRGRPGWCSGC